MSMVANQHAPGTAPGMAPDMAPGTRPPRMIGDIQVLRAIAIIMVMIEHAWLNLIAQQPWFTALLGHVPLWSGVDLFFVVSGFVIARGLVPGLQQPGRAWAQLRHFWIRRAFRLWPAAWAWLGIILLCSLTFVHPPLFGSFALNLQASWAGMFGYANLRFARHFMVPYGASYPYWSLSLEEQFYVLLPLLVLASRRYLPWVIIALLAIQLPLPHPRLYFFLRNDGLLWGVLLAISPGLQRLAGWLADRTSRLAARGWPLLAAALAALTQLSPPFETSPGFLLGLMAAVATLPVALASADRDLFALPGLHRALLWIGDRSYVLYLCHVPVYHLSRTAALALGRMNPVFTHLTDGIALMVALPLLLLAAQATHRWIETPMRRYGARLAGGSMPA